MAAKKAPKKGITKKPKKKEKILARTPRSLDESGCVCDGCGCKEPVTKPTNPLFDADYLDETLEGQSIEASLKFCLPQHNEEFLQAVNGKEYWGIIYELQEAIRNSLKYGSPLGSYDVRVPESEAVPEPGSPSGKYRPVDPRVDDALEAVQTFLIEALAERSIKSPY